MNIPLILPMREYFALKYLNHNTDTPTHMEAVLGEHAGEYYKAIDDEIHILMISYTWEVITRNSVAYNNVLPGKCSSKCKRKPDCIINKSKACYFVRGCIFNRPPPEYLNLNCPVVQCSTVSFILQLILGFRVKLLTSQIPFIRQNFIRGQPIFVMDTITMI